MSMFTPKYKSPGGQYYTLYRDMADQTHLLVAGATGSGKSVVINGIIGTMLIRHCPDTAALVLIDPKRVELVQYRKLPHCIGYASEPDDILLTLQRVMQIVDGRYKQMQRKRLKTYDGGHIYVIIDELADLMTTQGRAVKPLLQRICQVGRAARVHLIAGTQRPTTDVIPAAITVNIDSRVGLRCRNAQDSRNVIGTDGLEELPRYGQGIFHTPAGDTLYNIPMIPEAKLDSLVTYWTTRQCRA